MLPPLQQLSLAPRAPGRAATTGMFASDDAGGLHPLTRELVTNTYTLMPFSNAFHAPPPPPAEQRWVAKGSLDTFSISEVVVRRSALSTILAVRRWVKIGGKNGMDAEDVQDMLNGSPRETVNGILAELRNDDSVGYVFDGDNFEPDKAPFSVIIGELIDSGYTVVAVKTADQRMVNNAMTTGSVSQGFYKGWEAHALAHPDTFVMAMMPPNIEKETVTRKVDAFVFWGSTYVSEKTGRNYRFKPDHTPTQGWTEIQDFKQDDDLVCREVGVGDNTFVAVKKDF